MGISYTTETLNKLVQPFAMSKSVLDGALSTDYKFTGAKTVEVVTAVSQPLNDYKREGANRYGDPQELQDTVQELTLSQDKSWSMTIDQGNFKDQKHLKKTQSAIKMQQAEQVVPEYDRHGLYVLSHKAGNIVKATAALEKTNICDRIMEANAVLTDHEVPTDGRTLYIDSKGMKTLKLSEEFTKIEKIGYKSVKFGLVGTFDGMQVREVPKSRWPKGVNFIIVHKNSATAPKKIHEANCHSNPPGISGTLIEGRDYYDAFVLGARCNGVYAEITNTETVVAVPTISATTGAVTAAGGASVKYTVDGSDPRYSKTAIVGTSPAGVKAGMKIRAYAFKEGAYDSGVAEAVITG